MSAVLPAPQPAVAAPRAAVIVVAAGCAALTARPLLLDLAGGHPGTVLSVLFLTLLTVSLLWPSARAGAATTTPFRPVLPVPVLPVPVLPVLAIGVGAFVVGRALLAGSPPPAPTTAFVIALNSLAAVAEEAFFRRLVFGALLAAGPVAAVVGSAVLFAAVHVIVYGFWVLPLDLAAGLIFGWQRQASGSWIVPAVTHVAANVLVML